MLLFGNAAYAVYNLGNHGIIWRRENEQKIAVFMAYLLRIRSAYELDVKIRKKAIILATKDEVFLKLCEQKKEANNDSCTNPGGIDTVYDSIYAVPEDEYGQKLIYLMKNDDWERKVISCVLPAEYIDDKVKGAIQCDGYDAEKEIYYLVFCVPDLCKLKKFIESAKHSTDGRKFTLFCFNYQLPLIKSLVSNCNIRIRHANLDVFCDKFEDRYNFRSNSSDSEVSFEKEETLGSEGDNSSMNLEKALIFLRDSMQNNYKILDKCIRESEDNNRSEVLYIVQESLEHTLLKIGDIFQEYELDQEGDIDDRELDNVEVSIRDYEDSLVIELPELLPHRPQYDVSSKKMRYLYNFAAWKASYDRSFSKYFSERQFGMFDERVCLIFFHHYDRKKRNHPDLDNLEIKGIIDIIATYVLHDDSYEELSYYVKGVEDDRDFSEIIVVPEERLHDYV